MADNLKLSGSVLGVSFAVTLEKVEGQPGSGRFVGVAGGHPVDVTLLLNQDNDDLTVTGTLLGKPFDINAFGGL